MDYVREQLQKNPREFLNYLINNIKSLQDFNVSPARMIQIIEQEIDYEEQLNDMEQALEQIANGIENPIEVAQKALAKYRGED